MGIGKSDQSVSLSKRNFLAQHPLAYLKNLSAMTTRLLPLSLFFAAAMTFSAVSSASARAEIRTLSLYFPHTKESLTVTYKKDGRYIPSAMRQLNWFFRDWRRNVATRMDPETIDLLWALHRDLGAVKPAHIVSGYRSPATNGMLRRIGRKVARSSLHMRGKAIDVYFPDVPTARLRGSALARRVGGVGYYPGSGKYGFVHIDSGNVRHWPRMSSSRLASVISRYRSTIGARFSRRPQTRVVVASNRRGADKGPVNLLPNGYVKAPANVRRVAKANFVPVPRPRPLEVAMAAAAADPYIVPVSAPAGKQNFGTRPSLVGGGINAVLARSDLQGRNAPLVQRSNKAAKSSFVSALKNRTAKTVPLLRPMQANANTFWWSSDMDKLARRNGVPPVLGQQPDNQPAPTVLSKDDRSALEMMIAALTGKTPAAKPQTQHAPAAIQRVARRGKTNSLKVNRAAKGNMLTSRPLSILRRERYGKLTAQDKLAGRFEAMLKAAESPISFTQ